MNANAEYDRLTAIPRARRTEAQNARVRELARVLTASPLAPAARPVSKSVYLYTTIRAAERALKQVERDVQADQGEEAVESAWGDIVRSVTQFASPKVAAELLRRNGME